MAEFPVDPLMSKLLFMSQEFKCSEEIATIVAISQVSANYSIRMVTNCYVLSKLHLKVQNIFYYPTRGQESIKGILYAVYVNEAKNEC